jgi:hypothetical protein
MNKEIIAKYSVQSTVIVIIVVEISLKKKRLNPLVVN